MRHTQAAQTLAVAVVAATIVLIYYALSRGKKAVNPFPHVLDFPPARRHVIEGSDYGAEGLAKISSLRSGDVPPKILKNRAIPSTKVVDLDTDNLYSPTSFSTLDLRALGRFPDYALLSGVRDPEPCSPGFDINKACFRPFRPLRWNYHQHMGMAQLRTQALYPIVNAV